MHLQGGLELSLEHVLQACVQVSGEICTVPLENILYLQSNQNSVTEFLAPSMGVCSQKSFHCVVAELLSRLTILQVCVLVSVSNLWTYAPGAGGPLHEVFCMGSVFTCTETTCFAVIAVIACAEGMVVLKGVSVSGTVGTVLELYWHCMALHLFHVSFSIWNTFDVPSSVPLAVPVLT